MKTRHEDDSADAALARIRAIAWIGTKGHLGSPSQLALMAEFLRRMALWAEALSCPMRWPFFSVAERMVQRTQNGTGVQGHRSIPDLDSLRGDVHHGTYLENQICMYYVQWCVVRSTDCARRFQLPDPYEPAILICERGGSYTMENRVLYFGSIGLSIGSFEWRLSQPHLQSLEPDYLDQLDAEGSSER